MGGCPVFVGTSGWSYDWNPDGLEWYVRFSGLNAVELNASFYRWPSRGMILSWARRGGSLRWAVKVHRSVTHVHRLNERGLELASRFVEAFAPMDRLIDYYLFQLPPSYDRRPSHVERVERLVERLGLGARVAIEFRHPSWFSEWSVGWAEGLGFTLVSVDSPMGTWIVSSGGRVYLRMHGRVAWYAHDYSLEELEEVAGRVAGLEPRVVHVFFNNDHWMLENARVMRRLLEERLCRR